MVPGRGYLAVDTVGLRLDWRDALARGLAAVGAPGSIDDADFRLVWYADALDPETPAQCRDAHARGAAAPRPGEEFASIVATGLTVAALVADWFDQVDGAPLRAVAGDLLYFGDARKRCAAEDRLADALEQASRAGRPVVLIAHSFGSLVAYSHLSTRTTDAHRIERWITIGSLVGRPELRELLLGPDGPLTGLPAGVGSWVNVRDPEDALAAPLMGPSHDSLTAVGVVDRVTESTLIGDPHDPARYLSDPVTARAVLEGWCGPAGRAAAPGCPASP
jgi:hypothetical protein